VAEEIDAQPVESIGLQGRSGTEESGFNRVLLEISKHKRSSGSDVRSNQRPSSKWLSIHGYIQEVSNIEQTGHILTT
jgi:hypothetical protein